MKLGFAWFSQQGLSLGSAPLSLTFLKLIILEQGKVGLGTFQFAGLLCPELGVNFSSTQQRVV